MKCWNCGTENPKTAKICKNCGSDLAQPAGEEPNPDNPGSESRIQPAVWIGIGVAAVAIIITLLILAIRFTTSQTGGSTPEASPTATIETAAAAEETGEESSEESEGTVASMPSQGEGCDYDTCAWMGEEQCVACGGTWQDYESEAFCDCSESRWQSQELEWCLFEGGSWLEDEDRCTFMNGSGAAAQTDFASACADLFYNKESGDEAGYQEFRADCKAAGGVDQCWDENCSLAVCLCPNEENVPISCDWVNGQQIDSNIKCYDENGTCWLTIEPTSAFGSLSEGAGNPQVIVTTSDGSSYSSIDLERDANGCIYDANRISCLLTDDGAFNTTTVENIYICMDLCCLDLESLESGSVVVQSGNCPGSGNLEVLDFTLVKGVLTLQIRNSLGWDVQRLEVFLDDAKGDHWTSLDCHIDSKYDTVMDCEGWAVYKSGYATINFYYGSGSSACSVSGVRFQIPEMSRCNYDQKYCALCDTCCNSGYSCCECGCKKLDSGESCDDVCD